jgi:hypothetical protein
MIRFRTVESHVDLCSLPSPHRIPRSLAGMAFNFSKIDLSPSDAQTGKPKPPQSQPASSTSAHGEACKMDVQSSQAWRVRRP